MSIRHGHWIDGGSLPPTSGQYLRTVDPRTRQASVEIADGDAADIDSAVAAASRAQLAWARCSNADRSRALEQVAEAMTRCIDELIELEQASTGKIASQTRTEVGTAIEYLRYYAGTLRALGGRTIDQGARTHTYTRLEPFGVVGVITPWNLPLNQACRAVAPALAAGNSIVVKPSEYTSTSTLALAKIAADAGLPRGLLNVVTGTGVGAGEPLVSHPEVRRIAFTGSLPVGRHLARLAADRLAPVTLELGGKSPLLIFGDADTERAVEAAVSAVVLNAGQVCSATTRLLIEASVHDRVATQVVDAVARLEPAVDFGPMITGPQFEKVIAHFKAAESDGLVAATGASAYDDGVGACGFYVRPTVYVDVPSDARVAREELFGPVLVTMQFEDEAHAVDLANDTEYGLVASVWSGDVARGLRVAERIHAGQVAVNGGALGIEAPFGGYKKSGYGREKGLEALLDYTQTKTISLALDG